jgi:hypothetical protein
MALGTGGCLLADGFAHETTTHPWPAQKGGAGMLELYVAFNLPHSIAENDELRGGSLWQSAPF